MQEEEQRLCVHLLLVRMPRRSRRGGIRWVSSHCSGVVPFTALKWRPRWRELIPSRRARSSTVSGRSRRSIAQGNSAASGWSSLAGTGAVTNCAWPPVRCGGTTRRRATASATDEPLVETHQVQAQLHRGGLAGRGEHAAVVQVEHVRIDLNPRVAGASTSVSAQPGTIAVSV